MDQTVINGMFFIAFVLLPEFTSASITCNATQETDGYKHCLSQPPPSSKCKTCWELKNKTVIARDSLYDQEHVWSLTNQCITTKECHNYLHYTRDCQLWEDAHCKINCSHISDLKDTLTTMNSTLICITESFCLSKLMIVILVFVIVFIVVFVPLLWYNKSKCRRSISVTESVSYTPANEKNNMEFEEMKGAIKKTLEIRVDVVQNNSG